MLRFCYDNLMKALLFIALLASALLPVYNILFIYPSFEKELIKNTEDEAMRVATHLSSMFSPETSELQKDNLSHRLLHMAEEVKEDFKLWKLKLFSASGEIIYSTDPKDIGEINKHRYFHEIVAKGKPYSVIVKKDRLTLEGQKVTADIVETYVPIMRDGKFIGAFEIYYDITAKKQRFDALIKHYSCILFFIGVMSIALIMLLIRHHIALLAAKDKLVSELAKRRKTEDNLNRAQEVAHIGSWYLDIPKNELQWSKETYRIFGVPLDTHLTYEAFLQPVHPDDRQYVDKCWKAALSGEKYDIEHRIIVNGTVRWVSEKAELVFDENGKPLSSIGTVQDITERKKAEEEKTMAYEELYITTRELERFDELTVDRELRMIEMKREINALLERLGEPKKYETHGDI